MYAHKKMYRKLNVLSRSLLTSRQCGHSLPRILKHMQRKMAVHNYIYNSANGGVGVIVFFDRLSSLLVCAS